jgi:hypothetical protein
VTVKELAGILQRFPEDATVYTSKTGEVMKATLQTNAKEANGAEFAIYPQIVWLSR